MGYKNGAKCIVLRNNKILMIKQKRDGIVYNNIPGGGIEAGETPEQAAVRELFEECNVKGKIVRKLCEYSFPLDNSVIIHVFHMDIDNQNPTLGSNLIEEERDILLEVKWMSLDEISERDRAFLWAEGLMSLPQFFDEVKSWNDDISYPLKRKG